MAPVLLDLHDRTGTTVSTLIRLNVDPDDIVAVAPPDLIECSVEKVAVNAVMAGCRPEYPPVVLAAVEAARRLSCPVSGPARCRRRLRCRRRRRSPRTPVPGHR